MNPDRRQLLEKGLAVAAMAVTGVGTQSQAAQSKRTVTAALPDSTNPLTRVTWAPRIPALPIGGRFDLAGTLPPNVPRYGRFGLDNRGASLPAGMSLSEAGILSAGTARAGQIASVIFTYDLP